MRTAAASNMEFTSLQLSRFSEWVAANLGLHLPESRWRELEKSLVQAAMQAGFEEAEDYLAWLSSAAPNRGLVSALARFLTVGETYFFRDAKTFRALEESVLPSLIESRRASGRQLRIWSAGCCTGEEPYSIAILLARMLPDWKDWDLSILATDINPDFLDKARKGVYGKWSFRNTPEWVRTGFFRRHAEGMWEVIPEIKKRVTFGAFNLAAPVPSLPLAGTHQDLAICRNVLMYFTPGGMDTAIRNLGLAAAADAWLVVSPTEASQALHAYFTPSKIPDVLFYRRKNPHALSATPPPAMPGAASPPGGLPPVSAGPSTFQSPPAAPSPEAATSAALARAAKAKADLGRLDEALALCRRALDADRYNDGLLYLLSVILQEQGDYPGAADALDRALYLDPDFVLAHYGLGTLALRRGSADEAGRHFRNALALLQALPSDMIVPESDGITAGRMMKIVAESMRGEASHGR